MGVNSHEWPRQNFSLQYQYNIKRKRAKNKEKYQLGVIQYQIIQTNVIGIIWQMVRRITKEIIRVKELKLIPLLDVTYFSFNFVALKWLPFPFEIVRITVHTMYALQLTKGHNLPIRCVQRSLTYSPKTRKIIKWIWCQYDIKQQVMPVKL